jgi:hypothetical protein
MLRVCTGDQCVVDIARAPWLALSSVVRTLVEDTDTDDAPSISLPGVGAEDLRVVSVFVEYCHDHPLQFPAPPLSPTHAFAWLPGWYRVFLDMGTPPTEEQHRRFARLFTVAEYLHVLPLSTLCVVFMASQIVGQSSAHMRQWFGIRATTGEWDDREQRILAYQSYRPPGCFLPR